VKNPIGISPRPATAPGFSGWLAAWGPALVIGAAFAIVVGGTGFVSYTHISALMLQVHQSWKTAHIMPLVIDGQIVIGSVFFMVTTGKQRFLGLIGVVPGVLESLYANWESGIVGGYRDAVIAAVAAQVFAGSTFLFERWLKVRAAQGGGREARIVTVTVGCGHGVAEDRDGKIRDLWFHSKDCLGGKPSYRGVGQALDVHNEIVRQVVMAVADGGGEDEEPAAEPIRYAALNGSGS
jgi:hypothetical protein